MCRGKERYEERIGELMDQIKKGKEKNSGTGKEKKGSKVIEIRTSNLPMKEISKFKEFQGGLKQCSGERLEKLKTNLTTHGFIAPIFLWKNNIIDGHQRLKAVKVLLAEGYKLMANGEWAGEQLPYVEIKAKNKKQAGQFILTYNSQYGQITGLKDFLDDFNLDWAEINPALCLTGDTFIMGDGTPKGEANASLKRDFIMPPFSVLDSRQKYWLDRRDKWRALMGPTVASREQALSLGPNLIDDINEGASVFDPVLAEVIFKWFCPAGGHILNLFAGGVEPNAVAGFKGFKLTGIELRPEQVKETNQILERLGLLDKVNLICEDVLNLEAITTSEQFDMVFTCPPYYDLEDYGNDPADFANKSAEEFDKLMAETINKAAGRLKQNRFMAFVVGEVRDGEGKFRGLVPKTIEWANAAGLKYYNEIVLITSIGTLPLRIRKPWANRKAGKMHQNVLVFYKGELNKIPKSWGKPFDTRKVASQHQKLLVFYKGDIGKIKEEFAASAGVGAGELDWEAVNT